MTPISFARWFGDLAGDDGAGESQAAPGGMIRDVDPTPRRPVTRFARHDAGEERTMFDPHDRPGVCVFAPSLYLSVTIEPGGDGTGAEIHLHPAGQGFWIARLLARFGARPVLCGLAGGEAGAMLEALVGHWGVELDVVRTESSTACHIDDRRSGRRELVARDQPSSVRRHEVDDLYGRTLGRALETRMAVVTGRYPGDLLPLDVFERLGADLDGLGVTVVADLHGEELDAFLSRGSLAVLKVSDEEIAGNEGGTPTESEIADYVTRVAARHVGWVVASRAELGAVASFGGRVFRLRPPIVEVVDHSGAGDSMTAALVVARLRAMEPEAAMRLACAAGAANVTGHGRGSASVALIEQLAAHVGIEPMEVVG